MDNNSSYRIISVFDNAAERDYINEFLKFIGFFTYYDTLENNSNKNWLKSLYSQENTEGIDIVINYYGEKPYNNTKNKIYLYFDFDSLICGVSREPLKSKEEAINKFHVDNKMIMRRKILEDLINSLYRKDISEKLLTVLDAYAPKDGSYNLYLAVQIAHGLSVLKCRETQNNKETQISRIVLSEYLEKTLLNLQNSYLMLEKPDNYQNIYSLYSQLQIERIRKMIISFISPYQINENCKLISEKIINEKQKIIYVLDPMWVSNFLYKASLYNVEESYLKALNNIPDIDKNKIAYASILYEYGKHIEKKEIEKLKEKAIMLYEASYKNDPTNYRALTSKTRLEVLNDKIGHEGAKDKSRTALKQIFSNTSFAENYQAWENLSLKDLFYVFRISRFTGALDMADRKEYTVKVDCKFAAIAASYFEYGGLIHKIYDENEIKDFLNYHESSPYTWALWKLLEPWAYCCRDNFVTPTVNVHLRKFESDNNLDDIPFQKTKK